MTNNRKRVKPFVFIFIKSSDNSPFLVSSMKIISDKALENKEYFLSGFE
jgi:hypothetical protein